MKWFLIFWKEEVYIYGLRFYQQSDMENSVDTEYIVKGCGWAINAVHNKQKWRLW